MSQEPSLKRTHYCGDLRLSDAGTTAQLNGWVRRRRDHGGVIFVDLRDRTGITQVVFDPQIDEKAHALADAVRSEFVLHVSGTVRERAPGELLFTADAAFQAELSNGTPLSSEFRALFSDLDTKYTLSGDIHVDVRENDKRWLLTDVENNRTYDITREADSLSVYQGTVNPELATGEIEVAVDSLNILNTAKTPPFPVEDDIEVAEDIRMRYRFVDLRRPEMQKTLEMRHKAALAARNYMNEQGFLEIETPILMNSTPEGARDVLVPSRHYPGRFYALPQSPQQFKQILMMSGVDRYFQIARCFRDEDTRADRQLEFTQLDIEMSFAGVDDVLEVTEGLMKRIFEDAGEIPVQTPFLRLPYYESMARFGNDKPDTRFGMELTDLSDVMADCDFQVFTRALSTGGQVKGIAVPGGADFSRKDIDDLTEFVATYRAKGLAWVKVMEDEFSSGIVKFFKTEQLEIAQKRMGAKSGDIMFFVADRPKVVADALGNLRLHLGRKLNMIDETQYNFLWIVDYPLFEWNEEANRYEPFHHLFTGATEETLPLLDTDPGKVQSQHYDLVCNGYEICSGSVRIHQWDIQQKIFDILNIKPEDVKNRFGYFIDALEYGTPPHAGIAPGLDRIVMLMRNEENIREVIAFPKSQQGLCPLTHAPSNVTEEQLEELSIRVDIDI
ncbi:MAG: aspartate--tRNA ligase [Candidatus Poribacteria bacterium]|nr:aspartate--tRNA ligase [Candidatus Poribacteria bacterium]